MKNAVLKSKEVSQSSIFKPNFHLNEGKRNLTDLINRGIEYTTLGKIVQNIYTGGIFKRVFVSNNETGIPYISAQDMMNQNPKKTAKLISKKYTPRQDDMTLKKNTILVSCAGTVGNIRLIDSSFKNIIGSQDIIRVIPNASDYGFIYAYLSSKICHSYIQSLIYGSVVPRIEPNAVSNIPVPLFPESKQQEIHNLIVESAGLRVEANRLLEEAKKLLEKEINAHFQKELFKVGSNNIKEIFSSLQCRLDPPALISDGVETINKLKRNGVTFISLSECNTYIYRPGIFKRSYVEKGYPYIKGSELFDNSLFLRCQYLSKTKTPFVEQMLLRENQILVTCAGSCGQVKLITKEFEDKGAIGSQDIIRVEAKDSLFTTEYLFIYFQLPFVFDYIQSMKYGSVIERIEPFHVESIPVFVPSEEVSKEITYKISTYKKNMYVAFNKENQAISLVEKEIESWQQS
jgi:type I restriction enzyme S subunit